MATNTAIGATNTQAITFKNQKHKNFYLDSLQKCRCKDVYHKALVYCLGIDEDTREHVGQVYDFESGCVKPECLNEGWQTSGSEKIVRMAFNLYCNETPSVSVQWNENAKIEECQQYTVENLFCCAYARYFWEAVKIRYPDECNYIDWEEMYAEN